MELELFEEFILVARQGSIRKAAALLEMSPAALSQRMTVLEKAVGAPLLERGRQRTELTDTGRRLEGEVTKFIAQYHKGVERAAARNEELYASLKIAITAELMPFALASVLDSLNLRYPNLHLELLEDRDVGAEEGLLSGDVDLYFTFCYGEGYPPSIVAEPLLQTGMYALFRDDHPLARRPSVTLRELDEEQFILYPRTYARQIRETQEALLSRSGIQYSIYETATPHSLYSYLIPIGKGVILSPWPMPSKLTPNSVAVPLNEPEGRGAYSMLYCKTSRNPILPLIVQEILDAAKEGQTP